MPPLPPADTEIQSATPPAPGVRRSSLALLAASAIGVVFGDIGTSPLYALRECFGPHSGLEHETLQVMGVLSIIFWSLVIVIGVKYAALILRADNKGEGGIMALLALTPTRAEGGVFGLWKPLLCIGLLGTALLYADGVITPAISVMSAFEGLQEKSPAFEPWVLPLTVATLLGLFALQRLGTAKISAFFSPIMVIWFVTIAVLGAVSIARHPQVLEAVNPVWILRIVQVEPWDTFVVLGSVMLCITGGEALYADLGHFGRRPISLSWYGFVMPALLVNYFGQGALILTDMSATANPFYRMVPEWGIIPMVALAVTATAIASQSIITGMFSLTHQAVLMGILPRLKVVYTSSHGGHIFVPTVNLLVAVGAILLVVIFKSSSNLAEAYGLAVATDMACTTILFAAVMRRHRGWRLWLLVPFLAFFLAIDLLFLGANVLKIPSGGWLTLGMGATLFIVMMTWMRGRRVLAERFHRQTLAFDHLINSLDAHPVPRVSGTAVFLTPMTAGVPPTLLHHLKHNKVLHEQVVIMSMIPAQVPIVPESEQLEVWREKIGFWRVHARHGFNQPVDVPRLLRQARALGLQTSEGTTTYYLGRTITTPRGNSGMPRPQKRLFCAMAQASANNPLYFSIPPGRMVELGIQIDL